MFEANPFQGQPALPTGGGTGLGLAKAARHGTIPRARQGATT